MNDSNRVRYIFGSVDANGAITLGTPYGLITGDPTDCWNPKVAVDSSTGKILAGKPSPSKSDFHISAVNKFSTSL